jgi:Xaa-Pro dipeptidase
MVSTEYPTGKYPAKLHASLVAEALVKENPSFADAVIFLESQKTRMNEDNDQEAPFRCVLYSF